VRRILTDLADCMRRGVRDCLLDERLMARVSPASDLHQ
jgi:hypothetical protein